jgi:hypothetical protein
MQKRRARGPEGPARFVEVAANPDVTSIAWRPIRLRRSPLDISALTT